jgi:hypothetical protein
MQLKEMGLVDVDWFLCGRDCSPGVGSCEQAVKLFLVLVLCYSGLENREYGHRDPSR